MIRDSFVFYKSFADAIDLLPEHEQVGAYRAIVRYALTGEEPQIDGMAQIVFTMARPQIDANTKRFHDGHKGADYGKLGGRPKKNPIGVISENPSGVSEKTPNVNVNVNDNVNVNVNDNVNDNENVNANNIKTLSDSVRPSQQSAADKINYQYIIDNLNGKTGKHYRVTDKTRSLIRARIRDGFTESDFLKVIDNKVRSRANDPKMSQYLRPETLFGTKFEGYLNETHQAYVSGDLPF